MSETRFKEAVPIPIDAAQFVAHEYGYDQLVIIARAVGTNGREHVTTYGKNKLHCAVAARIGHHLKKIMAWPEEKVNAVATVTAYSEPVLHIERDGVLIASLTPSEAIKFAQEVLDAATTAEDLPGIARKARDTT